MQLGGRGLNAREEFAFRQVVEKCNSALADNTILVLEVNELRKELFKIYQELADVKNEFNKCIGIGTHDIYADADPLEFASILSEKVEKDDKKSRKIPEAKIPKSVKTSRVKRKDS